MTLLLRTALLLAVTLATSGCLINSNRERVVDERAERVTVGFESETALRIFTQAVDRRYHREKDLGESTLTIPFLIDSRVKRTLSENAFFNRAVKRADLNSDGTISEAEARAYANTWN